MLREPPPELKVFAAFPIVTAFISFSGVAALPKLQADVVPLTKKVDEFTSMPPVVILTLPTTSHLSIGAAVPMPILSDVESNLNKFASPVLPKVKSLTPIDTILLPAKVPSLVYRFVNVI